MSYKRPQIHRADTTSPVPSKELVDGVLSRDWDDSDRPAEIDHREVLALVNRIKDLQPKPAHEREPPHCVSCACGMAAPDPDYRHPKLQALLAENARKSIELQIIDGLLADPDEAGAGLGDYWTDLHDRVREIVLRAALTCRPLLHIFTAQGQPCVCGAVPWGKPSNTPVPEPSCEPSAAFRELVAIAKAAERVCAFDWSDNDEDAVATIDRLSDAVQPWLARRFASTTRASKHPGDGQ